MVTKLGPLCKVKLKNQGDKLVAEKAGVGGSTPSLATIISKNLIKPRSAVVSPLSVRIPYSLVSMALTAGRRVPSDEPIGLSEALCSEPNTVSRLGVLLQPVSHSSVRQAT
jgi:hypothetical protein